jgi:hypothetical protein
VPGNVSSFLECSLTVPLSRIMYEHDLDTLIGFHV